MTKRCPLLSLSLTITKMCFSSMNLHKLIMAVAHASVPLKLARNLVCKLVFTTMRTQAPSTRSTKSLRLWNIPCTLSVTSVDKLDLNVKFLLPELLAPAATYPKHQQILALSRICPSGLSLRLLARRLPRGNSTNTRLMTPDQVLENNTLARTARPWKHTSAVQPEVALADRANSPTSLEVLRV